VGPASVLYDSPWPADSPQDHPSDSSLGMLSALPLYFWWLRSSSGVLSTNHQCPRHLGKPRADNALRACATRRPYAKSLVRLVKRAQRLEIIRIASASRWARTLWISTRARMTARYWERLRTCQTALRAFFRAFFDRKTPSLCRMKRRCLVRASRFGRALCDVLAAGVLAR
jgi:hypothetical protein